MSGRVTGVLGSIGLHLGQDQRRQIIALDDEFHEMDLQITKLQAENQKLRAQVQPLEEKVKRLEERIKEATTKQAAKKTEIHLDETDVEIITTLAKHASAGHPKPKTTLAYMAEKLKTSQVRASVYLRRLDEAGYVRLVASWEGYSFYRLDDLGEEYAVVNGIVK